MQPALHRKHVDEPHTPSIFPAAGISLAPDGAHVVAGQRRRAVSPSREVAAGQGGVDPVSLIWPHCAAWIPANDATVAYS